MQAIEVAQPQEVAPVAPVPHEYSGLAMVMTAKEAERRMLELQVFVKSVMVPDVDYGKIPGAGDKPTLLQPGAQKLAELYGLAHRFEPVEIVRDWDRLFFYFEYRTVLSARRDGSFVGEGLGSCNSRESKYAYRWIFENEIPRGLDPKSLETQIRTSRKNGKLYTVFKLPNQDLASVVNTIQKMAAKRSYIHAVIAATRSSGIFTQDVEDLPAAILGRPETVEEPTAGTAPPAKDARTTSREPPKTEAPEDPAMLQLFAQRATELEQAENEAAVGEVARLIDEDRRAKRLLGRCLTELKKLRDLRMATLAKAAAKAAVDADPLPEGWGGDAPKGHVDANGDPTDGPPPDDKPAREPGEEG